MSLGTLVGALGPDIDRLIAKVFGTLPLKVRFKYLITMTFIKQTMTMSLSIIFRKFLRNMLLMHC